MKNPARTLHLIYAGQTLTALFAAAAVSITVLEVANVDLAEPLTLGGFLSLAAAMAIGYASAAIVDKLMSQATRPRRERLQDAIAEQTWPDYVPGESIAVAYSIRMFLNDLHDGLPYAVAMTKPGGRMPVTGDEWIAYTTSDGRNASLDTHSQSA
ncbi:hypothetical protein B0E38_06467 [Streptomyces sp. 111WW2]|uniref:hypothetical protein n=1 Tax=Streptomyces sp. 111WW2 TaxID=1945515 RepID=UPI000D0C8F18|nr:hypothetical protein [Streptomyces sp. 111WW2]PSK47990.1 hypothetical protein B0E38_06467 [Streptomyces sp. 111WW2]